MRRIFLFVSSLTFPIFLITSLFLVGWFGEEILSSEFFGVAVTTVGNVKNMPCGRSVLWYKWMDYFFLSQHMVNTELAEFFEF